VMLLSFPSPTARTRAKGSLVEKAYSDVQRTG